MTITQLVDLYATQRDIEPGTVEQYRYVAQSLAKHLGHDPELAELDSNQINLWLIAMQAKLSPFTVHSRRTTMLTLLNHAERLQLITGHLMIRTIKLPDSLIVTLTTREIADLRRACERERGSWHGLSVAGYLRTFIDATLETAFRRSDLHRIVLTSVFDRPLQLIQKKTQHLRFGTFSPELIRRILHWHNGQHLIWPEIHRRIIPQRLHRLGLAVGIPKLTHTLLRKTAITDVERQQPGTGWIFAGHRGPETTQRWYTDKQQQYLGLPKPRF